MLAAPPDSWFEENTTLLAGGAIGVAVIVLVARKVPGLIQQIPVDYYTQEDQPSVAAKESNPLATLLKNFLGVILIVAGIAMCVLPGPGTVTILLGLGMMEFPGKYKLERKIVSQSVVLKSVNETRAEADVPPLQL